MSPPQLEGTPKEKWELQPEKPSQSVHPLWAKSSRFWRGFACTWATFFDGLGNTSQSRAKGGPQNFKQAVNTGAYAVKTLTTLEESVSQLWARQPPSELEAEFSLRINVLNSNNDGPTPKAHFKPTFKQVFSPRTSTIEAFLTIYKTFMRLASDKVKKEHILTCLHPACQEVVVPELRIIEMWEDIKQLLIDNFGGDLSLEVKKDAIMHISFKPKETLAKFTDRFYLEGQQLITRRQLTAHEACMAFTQALKVNQLLCLHFKAHKAMLSSQRA
ncbi:hypothetical protein DSO57_1009864 [Entomophthora muscae]|uniref:Uncharacterized protein n=1 Tax=Entomophthora muscae TaxID=34485 RepID=A0ACC2SJR0_9FUNG|nr:hypothetical protein DSO57_1009864 [Entomophthora muscae]